MWYIFIYLAVCMMLVLEGLYTCVCVCMYVCEREREGERDCVCWGGGIICMFK